MGRNLGRVGKSRSVGCWLTEKEQKGGEIWIEMSLMNAFICDNSSTAASLLSFSYPLNICVTYALRGESSFHQSST